MRLNEESGHGALIDAELLARVYIQMTAGEVGLFEEGGPKRSEKSLEQAIPIIQRQAPLYIRATKVEQSVHEAYMQSLGGNS